MDEKTIQSPFDFHKLVDDYGRQPVIYRGVSNSRYALIPKIGRYGISKAELEKVEKSLLRLEIAELNQAMQTFDRPLTSVGHGTLCFGEGKEVGALEVVEIGQAVKRVPLGLRQHGQPLAVAGTCRLVGLQRGPRSGRCAWEPSL